MKKTFFWTAIVLTTLLLAGCDQQDGEESVVDNAGTADENIPAESEIAPDDDVADPASDEVEDAEEPAGPEVFVPITVEDFGLTTVVPADWPQIEGDPLLKNAWGPGEFRFVAFHSVPGEDVRPAMAQLLGITLEELVEDPPEGEYWEEQIGGHDWAIYNVENPEIGLGQSVSMTVQDGIVYIVSLFVEMDYRESVLNAVLENFELDSEIEMDDAAAEEETADVGEEEIAEEGDVIEVDLLDSSWTLVQFGDSAGQLQEVLPGVEITAVFNAEGRVAGSAGCNNYASLYTIDEEALTISLPAMTRKTCDDPEGIMLQETSYLSNITSAASYQIEGKELQLLNSDGSVVLVFSSP